MSCLGPVWYNFQRAVARESCSVRRVSRSFKTMVSAAENRNGVESEETNLEACASPGLGAPSGQ